MWMREDRRGRRKGREGGGRSGGEESKWKEHGRRERLKGRS